MYGVDQCRRCGIPIKPHGEHEREEFIALMKHKKQMPEAQWRKMGLLAPPTHRQDRFPALGCCYECGYLLMRQKYRPFIRVAKVGAGCFCAFALIWTIGTYVMH
jgi:hypothetical protein